MTPTSLIGTTFPGPHNDAQHFVWDLGFGFVWDLDLGIWGFSLDFWMLDVGAWMFMADISISASWPFGNWSLDLLWMLVVECWNFGAITQSLVPH